MTTLFEKIKDKLAGTEYEWVLSHLNQSIEESSDIDPVAFITGIRGNIREYINSFAGKEPILGGGIIDSVSFNIANIIRFYRLYLMLKSNWISKYAGLIDTNTQQLSVLRVIMSMMLLLTSMSKMPDLQYYMPNVAEAVFTMIGNIPLVKGSTLDECFHNFVDMLMSTIFEQAILLLVINLFAAKISYVSGDELDKRIAKMRKIADKKRDYFKLLKVNKFNGQPIHDFLIKNEDVPIKINTYKPSPPSSGYDNCWYRIDGRYYNGPPVIDYKNYHADGDMFIKKSPKETINKFEHEDEDAVPLFKYDNTDVFNDMFSFYGYGLQKKGKYVHENFIKTNLFTVGEKLPELYKRLLRQEMSPTDMTPAETAAFMKYLDTADTKKGLIIPQQYIDVDKGSFRFCGRLFLYYYVNLKGVTKDMKSVVVEDVKAIRKRFYVNFSLNVVESMAAINMNDVLDGKLLTLLYKTRSINYVPCLFYHNIHNNTYIYRLHTTDIDRVVQWDVPIVSFEYPITLHSISHSKIVKLIHIPKSQTLYNKLTDRVIDEESMIFTNRIQQFCAEYGVAPHTTTVTFGNYFDSEKYSLQVMEYIPNVTFYEYLSKIKSPENSHKMNSSLVQNLLFFDAVGLIHNDMHMANIIVDAYDRAYIIDFDMVDFADRSSKYYSNSYGYLRPYQIDILTFMSDSIMRLNIIFPALLKNTSNAISGKDMTLKEYVHMAKSALLYVNLFNTINKYMKNISLFIDLSPLDKVTAVLIEINYMVSNICSRFFLILAGKAKFDIHKDIKNCIRSCYHIIRGSSIKLADTYDMTGLTTSDQLATCIFGPKKIAYDTKLSYDIYTKKLDELGIININLVPDNIAPKIGGSVEYGLFLVIFIILIVVYYGLTASSDSIIRLQVLPAGYHESDFSGTSTLFPTFSA